MQLMIEKVKMLAGLLRRDERGVTTVEYAVMLVLVAIAVAGFGAGLSNSVTGVFQDLINALTP